MLVRTNKRVRFFFLRSPFSLCFFLIFFAFASFERTRDSSRQNLDRLRTVASCNSFRHRPIVRSHRGRFVSVSVRRFSVSLSQCLQRSLRNARIFRRLIVQNWRNVGVRSMSRYCPMRKVLCNIEKSSFLFSFSLASYRLSELRIKKFLRLNKKEKEIGA